MPILTSQERIGTVLDGKYRLDRVLGEGGMGVVYDAVHVRLDRRVAVKFLHAQFSQSGEVVSRFVREAQATSKLVHPNVVAVHDVDVSPDGCVFMVLEFLHGQSLASRLEEVGTLSPQEMFSVIGPVCEALALAHAAGIVHRDIKPDNVFLSRDLGGKIVPKVLDFGIAKLTQASAGSATQTGAVMGTPLYMSPEQAMGRSKDIGPAADQWSVAVMAYETLTGRPPFDVPTEASATMIVMAVVMGDLHPLKKFRPELGAISDVLERAIQRDPSARYASVAELSEALRIACDAPTGAVSSEPRASVPGIAATRISAPPNESSRASTATPYATPSMRPSADTVSPPRRTWTMAIVGLGVLVALAIAGVMLVGPGAPRPAAAGPATPPAPLPSAAALPSTPPEPSVVAITPPPPTEVAPVPALPPTSGTLRRPREPRGASGTHEPQASVVPTTVPVPPIPVATTTSERPAVGLVPTTHGGRESAGAQLAPPSVAPPTSVSAPPPTTTHRAGGVSIDQF